MDTSTVAVVPLAEVVADFHNYLSIECGMSDLAQDLVPGFLYQELQHIANGAVNRSYVNMHDHMARTRNIFVQHGAASEEQAEDIADELYILLRDELPQQVGRDKSIYTTSLDRGVLSIKLLMSRDAAGYGVDLQAIVDQVV